MSRIHEALRRIEQDRAAAQGLRPDSARLEQARVAELIPLESEKGTAIAAEPAPTVSSAIAGSDGLLGRCPRSVWAPDSTMLFLGPDEEAPGTEQFRTLRSRLLQIKEKQPLKKILITSALREEGRSFVAANLAQVLACQQGRRALLIDGDLRYPALHVSLGVPTKPGLADYLRGDADELEILRHGQMENLFLLPAGSEAADPAGLAVSNRWKQLLDRMEPLFDWIIIDSPAAVLVSDASVLAAACDGVLIVVRAQATPADAASKIRQQFLDQRLLGVVLNGAPAKPSANADYGDSLSTSRHA